MSTFDPSDPFNLLPRPAKSDPPPSILERLLSPRSEAPSPEKLKQIESILRSNPYQQSSPTPTVAEKSLSQKLRDHVQLGFRLLNEAKLTKASGTQWVARLRGILHPLLGNVPYLQGLEERRKKSAATGLTAEEFSNTLAVANDFADFVEATAGAISGYAVSRPSRPPATRSVLVIHGKDELNTRRLSDFLREDEGVVPIVMMSQPGMSRPLTDKFEEEASRCAFAFALFTADDFVKSGSDEYRQARPNVIYETGWFIARLGKNRTVLLLQSGAEMHTDLQGVSRIHFTHDIREKCQDIHRELRAAALG